MYVMQREIPVFDDINYRVEHNLENDVGRSKGATATLMRDARVNWFMLPFPLSSTLVSAWVELSAILSFSLHLPSSLLHSRHLSHSRTSTRDLPLLEDDIVLIGLAMFSVGCQDTTTLTMTNGRRNPLVPSFAEFRVPLEKCGELLREAPIS